MKKLLSLVIISLALGNSILSQTFGVGIGTNTPSSTAILDIQSTSKGLLIPRLTLAQRNAISTPATGLLIYQTDNTGGFYYFNGTGWIQISTGSATNYWTSNGSDVYNNNSGEVGIGTNSPVYDLHISKASPSIGFNDASFNQLSGTITGTNSNLVINAFRKPLGGSITQGNLILQTGTGLPNPFTAGNVGIGTATPSVKLQVEDGTNITAASGGFLQIGSSTAANIAVDDNQIQARTNGTAGKLFLQSLGGDLQIGGTNNIIINDGYQLYRNRPLSTNADLLPIAYGKISGAGTALSGTGNLSVTKPALGEYRIVLLGENNLYTNRNQYTIMATINGWAGAYFIQADIMSDNAIHVFISRPDVNWVNTSGCGCDSQPLVSYIENAKFYEEMDRDFSIIIYKQ